MAKSRALLTETEREQIAGDHGDERRYQATSRARARIRDELETDVEILKEHNPELYAELRDAVVDAETDPNDADRDTSETGENSPETDPSVGEGNGSDAVDNDDEADETVDDYELRGNPENTLDDQLDDDEDEGDDNDDDFRF